MAQERALWLLALTAALVVAAVAQDEEPLRWRGHRPHRRRTTPPPPPPPPAPAAPVLPPRQLCNGTIVMDDRGFLHCVPEAPPPPAPRCNGTIGTHGGSDLHCAPPPAPAPPQPPHWRCPAHCGCSCPKPPAHHGGSSSGEAECVAPLAPLMTCWSFLTGSEQRAPTADSDCCRGLGVFIAAAATGGDRLLKCLCPVILGQVNRGLQHPVDPSKTLFLPISCGVVLPPQLMYVCFTGQEAPALAADGVPLWEKAASILP